MHCIAVHLQHSQGKGGRGKVNRPQKLTHAAAGRAGGSSTAPRPSLVVLLLGVDYRNCPSSTQKS